MFIQNKDEPPLNKNQPPVTGAIFWVRSLFHSIKHTIVKFQKETGMLQSKQGTAVSYTLTPTVCVCVNDLKLCADVTYLCVYLCCMTGKGKVPGGGKAHAGL